MSIGLASEKSGRDGVLIGYVHVLDVVQDLNLECRTLIQAGCSRVFVDAIAKSGMVRPEFRAALAHLRAGGGDALIVCKLDPLGRSLVETLRTIEMLHGRAVRFQSLAERFDSGTDSGRFLLDVQRSLIESFLDLNSRRRVEGAKAAVARGRVTGRPRKLSEADLAVGRTLLASGDLSKTALARRLGINRFTLYRYLQQPGTLGETEGSDG